MLFPQGIIVHQNLNTSFTQVDALLGQLKSILFVGYIRLVAADYVGILVLNAGAIVNAWEETPAECHAGSIAAENVFAKAHAKDASLNVYQLSTSMVALFAALLDGETLYKDLSSDMASLDKLIAKLQDDKHTGIIDIQMPTSPSAGTILMRDGRIVESILSTKRVESIGVSTVEQIVKLALAEPARFTVYRANPAHARDNVSEQLTRQNALAFWQDMLMNIESVVDGSATSGTFLTAFKRVCMDKSTQFPFLDPFMAEFEYRNGQIKLTGAPTIAHLNQGLCQCLAQTVTNLLAQSAHKGLDAKLQPVAKILKLRYASQIADVGLSTALPAFFGAS